MGSDPFIVSAPASPARTKPKARKPSGPPMLGRADREGGTGGVPRPKLAPAKPARTTPPVVRKAEKPKKRESDAEFFTRLPPIAKADVDEQRRGAEFRAQVFRTGSPALKGFLGIHNDPHGDLLKTNPDAYVAQKVGDAVAKWRVKADKIKVDAPVQATIAGKFGVKVTPKQEEAAAFQKLGQHESTFLDVAGTAANAPFSSIGNLLQGHPRDALKNLAGQGRQTTIASTFFEPGSAAQEATDFLLGFVGTPELAGLKSATGTAARRVVSRSTAGKVYGASRVLTPEDSAATRAFLGGATKAGAKPKPDLSRGPNLITRPPLTPSSPGRPRSLEQLPYIPATGRGGEAAVADAVAARAAASSAREATTVPQAVQAARGVERTRGRRKGAEQAYRETLTKFGKRADLEAVPSEGQLAKAGEMFGPTHIAEPGASLAPKRSGTVPVRPEYDLEGFADDLVQRANEIIKPVEAEIRGLAQDRWHSPGGRFLSGAEKDRALKARGYRQLGASARGKNIPGKTIEDYYPDAVAELTAAGRTDVAELWGQADELVARASLVRREAQARRAPSFLADDPARFVGGEGDTFPVPFAPRREAAAREAAARAGAGATERQVALAKGVQGERPRLLSAREEADARFKEGLDIVARVLAPGSGASPAQRELAKQLLLATPKVEARGRRGAPVPRPKQRGVPVAETRRRADVAARMFAPPDPRTFAITDAPPASGFVGPSAARVRATPSEFLGPGGERLAGRRGEEAAASGQLEGALAGAVRPRTAVNAGEALAKAEQKLKDIQDRIYSEPTKQARPRAGEGHRYPTEVEVRGKASADAARAAKQGPDVKQRQVADTAFTHSSAGDLADSAVEYAAAGVAAEKASPSGVRVGVPFTRMRAGVNIPLLPARFRDRVGHLKSAKWLQMAADTWDRMIVTSYGPNPIAATAARQMDHWVAYNNASSYEWIVRRSLPFSPETRRAVTSYIEGTLTDAEKALLTPEARAFGDELAGYVEHLTDQFKQAGGNLTRLRDQYVFHTMPPEQWARFQREFGGSSETVFGTEAKFAKHRAAPDITIKKLQELGYDPVDDFAGIVAARAAAHNRAMADMALVKSLQRHKWPAERLESAASTVNDRWGVPPAAYADKEILLPPSVNETLQRVQEARHRFSNPGAIPPGLNRGIQKVNSQWKMLALMTTGYDIRNQIGDMILIAQAGHNPFMAMVRGLEALAGESGGAGRSVVGRAIEPLTSKLSRGGQDYATIARTASMLGATRTGVLAKDVKAHLSESTSQGVRQGGAVGAAGLPVRALGKLRRERENLNRAGLFAGLTKGEGPLLAGERTGRAAYDYGDVGSLVDVLRRYPVGAPFASWLVKNIPAQIRHIAARPRNILTLNAVQQQLNEEAGNPSQALLPDFARKALALPIKGVGWVTMGLPQADANRLGPLFRGQFGQVARDTIANFGPVVQAGLGAAFGVNPLTGSKIPDRVAETGADRVLRSALPLAGDFILGPPGDKTRATDAAGNRIGVNAVSGRGSFFLRQLNPALATYGRLAGEPGKGRGPFDPKTLREIGTGIRTYGFSDPQQITTAKNRSVAIFLENQRLLRAHVQAFALAGEKVDYKTLPEYKKMQDAYLEYQALTKAGE